jgi:hypothetical protein
MVGMLRMILGLLPLPLALTLALSPAASQLSRDDIRTAELVAENCDLSGWSTDRSPEGLAVRASPGGRARILGRIPYDPGKPDEDYRGLGVPFKITGSRNGWLRIRGAVDYYERPALKRQVIFAGEGWVWGEQVGFKVQSARVRAVPDRNAPVLREMRHPEGRDKEWLTSVASLERIHACRGGWALISYRGKAVWGDQRLAADTIAPDGVGWVTNICGAQETTCDMGSHD